MLDLGRGQGRWEWHGIRGSSARHGGHLRPITINRYFTIIFTFKSIHIFRNTKFILGFRIEDIVPKRRKSVMRWLLEMSMASDARHTMSIFVGTILLTINSQNCRVRSE